MVDEYFIVIGNKLECCKVIGSFVNVDYSFVRLERMDSSWGGYFYDVFLEILSNNFDG